MDLIDRNKALDAVSCIGDENSITTIGHFVRILKGLPSEQSEQSEIIRCKDCRYYDGFGCSRYADETFGMTHSTQEYGFCWLAERREE